MITPALMVIAHWGASSYFPENTFAAFDPALRMKARHLELNVAFMLKAPWRGRGALKMGSGFRFWFLRFIKITYR